MMLAFVYVVFNNILKKKEAFVHKMTYIICVIVCNCS